VRNHIAFVLGLSFLVGACDSSQRTGTARRDGGILVFDKDSGTTIVIYDGGVVGNDDLAFDKDAFFIQDPPPRYCALDGGAPFTPPPLPGGTLDCPDDKNREGCPCPEEGKSAPCWPGARANRNLGICMDGTTTCKRYGEITLAWGECVGYVLPDPGATGGAEACQCFSHGQWDIVNTVPCTLTYLDQNMVPQSYEAYSSYVPQSGGTPQCGDQSGNPVIPKPTDIWSADTVTADCAGRFTLCYQIKAGNVMNRLASDCVVGKSCTTGDYLTVGMEQAFPPLPAWRNTNSSCVEKWDKMGGYWEMTVVGTSITCDAITEHVFNFGGFCPSDCLNTPDMGTPNPACANCTTMGSGRF